MSLLFISVCFLAYSNADNDNFKGVVSLFGSGTTHYRCALSWTTLATLAGLIAALFLAQALIVKFSGKGVAPGDLAHALPFTISVTGSTLLYTLPIWELMPQPLRQCALTGRMAALNGIPR
ncbi:MAG: hypothetical protein PHR16_05530 [Methylovulum sp.]|nr:hypothetical protein [Methylovulum sp.]